MNGAGRSRRGRPLLLVVDDDPGVRVLLRRIGEQAGCDVIEAPDGGEALRHFYGRRPDIVVLDVKMPGLSGWDVLERIRELAATPVLMLTARSDQSDKVRGLRHGADDYVTKPFGSQELEARIEALLRRRGQESDGAGEPPASPVYSDSVLEVDFAQRRVEVDGRELQLTPREFALAAALVRHPNQVLSQGQLLEMVWGGGSDGSLPQVKLYVGYLRRKLREAGADELVETVRGFGYRYRPPDAG